MVSSPNTSFLCTPAAEPPLRRALAFHLLVHGVPVPGGGREKTRANGNPIRPRNVKAATSLGALAVTAVKLLNLACGVEDAALAREERVRLIRNFDINHRVGVAVFPLDCLVRRTGGTGQERVVHRAIAEHHGVVIGVNALLHFILLIKIEPEPDYHLR